MLAATRSLGNLAPNLEVLSCKSNSPQCFCSLLAPRMCELNICEHILICLGPRFILGLLELFWPLLHGGGLAYFVPTVNQILHKFFSPWVCQNMERKKFWFTLDQSLYWEFWVYVGYCCHRGALVTSQVPSVTLSSTAAQYPNSEINCIGQNTALPCLWCLWLAKED